MRSETGAGDLVIDLLEAAVRAEGKGQLNVGKLLRACATSVARSEASRTGFPAGAEDLVRDLRDLSRRVADLGLNRIVADRIALGAQLIADGEQSYVDRFPDPYVCRRCGLMTPDRPTDSCEACGAHELTFERFVPVYWLTLYQPPDALHRLAHNPDLFAKAVGSIPQAALGWSPAEHAWSVVDVLRHVRDADSVLSQRVRLMLEHDDPELEFQPVFEWTDERAASPEGADEVLAAYASSRAATVERLRSVEEAGWRRTGRHQELGVVSLCEQASYFAAHELIHLRQIEQIRRSLASRDAGIR